MKYEKLKLGGIAAIIGILHPSSFIFHYTKFLFEV